MSLNHCRRIDPGIPEQLNQQQRHASLSSFISIPWESRNWQVSKHGKTWNNHEEDTRSNETLWHVILGHHHVMRSFGGAEISACSSITNPRVNSLIQFFMCIFSLSPPSSIQFYRSLYTVLALKRVSDMLSHESNRCETCTRVTPAARKWEAGVAAVAEFSSGQLGQNAQAILWRHFRSVMKLSFMQSKTILWEGSLKLRTVQCSIV